MSTTENDQEHVSVRVSDPELTEVLRNGENKSAVVREALTLLAEEQGAALDRGDIDREQHDAWMYMRDRVGVGGSIGLDVVETELAQVLQKNAKLVRTQIVKPLRRAGYIDVRPTMEDVRVTVRNPRRTQNDE